MAFTAEFGQLARFTTGRQFLWNIFWMEAPVHTHTPQRWLVLHVYDYPDAVYACANQSGVPGQSIDSKHPFSTQV